MILRYFEGMDVISVYFWKGWMHMILRVFWKGMDEYDTPCIFGKGWIYVSVILGEDGYMILRVFFKDGIDINVFLKGIYVYSMYFERDGYDIYFWKGMDMIPVYFLKGMDI